MKKTKITMRGHVKGIKTRRLINSEYQRGFMEGQQAAALSFAGCIDGLLQRYNHVAIAPVFADIKTLVKPKYR